MNTPPNGLQEPNGQTGPNGTNGQNGPNGRKGNGWLSWWSLFFAVLLAGIGSYIAFVLVPSFRSPRSRVYASILGYPSLMRLTGKPIEVEVEKARVRTLAKTISAEGHVGYLNEIPIRTEGQGIVTAVLAEVGQEVKKGDVLLWINTGGEATRVDELSVELREAEFKQARAMLARTQTMFNARGASAQDLELAQLGVLVAKAALAVAREQYKYSLLSRSKLVAEQGSAGSESRPHKYAVPIVATFSGTVFQRTAQLGENLVLLTEPLMMIGDELTFVAALDQRYAASVNKGDKAVFYMRAYPGVPLEGEVIRVANNVMPEAQKLQQTAAPWAAKQPPDTFYAWLAVKKPKPDMKLLYGMNGYCVFQRSFKSLAIPESALMRYSGRTGTVLTLDENNKLQVNNITYTGSDDGWVAIDSGLKEGDRVVVEGQVALKPGDQVIVQGN